MKNTKKGFTLVELLVVIAIVAILATVAIIGYTSFTKKAEESNDRTLVAQLNTAITKVDGKYETFHEVVEALAAQGFDVSKIKATSETYEILWDMDAQAFFYTADEEKSGANIWIIANEVHATNSTYYTGSAASVEAKLGFDAGNSRVSVVYTGTGAAIIRTNGGNITVNSGTVTHYGVGALLTVADGANYTEKGSCAFNSADIENVGDQTAAETAGYTYVTTEAELKTALENKVAKIALGADINVEHTLTNAAHYYFTVAAETELNLNGYNIDAYTTTDTNTYKNSFVFYVNAGASLTVTGQGRISIEQNENMSWSACTAVIAGRGDVTIDGAVTIANLGGTAMAYAIDMHSWGAAESSNLTIKSGYVYSAQYAAIRLNRQGNSTSDKTTTFNLVVEDGVVEGTFAIFTHDGSASSNGIYNVTFNGGRIISTTNAATIRGMQDDETVNLVNNGATLITK